MGNFDEILSSHPEFNKRDSMDPFKEGQDYKLPEADFITPYI